MLAISRFNRFLDVTPKPEELGWDELRARMTKHEKRVAKDRTLWSPVRYKPGTTRGNENVETLYALVLDFDHGTDPQTRIPEWSQWEYFLYSSHSSTAEHPRWRVTFPLKTPVPAEDWPALFDRVAPALAGLSPCPKCVSAEPGSDPTKCSECRGAGEVPAFDRSCRDQARMHYTPAHPPGVIPFVFTNSGEWLDPEAFPALPAPEPIHLSRPKPQSDLGLDQRVKSDILLARALDRIGEGRHNRSLWLAAQLRDNEYSEGEAEAVLREFGRFCPTTNTAGKPEPFTEAELLHNLRSAYSRAPRNPWDPQRRVFRFPSANGKPARVIEVESELTLGDAATIAFAACEKLKEDAGAIWDDEVLQAIALCRHWDVANWARIRERLQKRRVSMRELYARLPRIELAQSDRERMTESENAPISQLAGDTLKDCPLPTLAIPEPYFVHENRVGKMVTDQDGDPKPVTLAFAPVLPTGRLRDAVTGEESLLLSWRWQNAAWISRVVERSQALTGRELVKLASVGFPVGDDSAKGLVGYLHRVEAANRHTLPCAAVSSHLGWQGDPEKAPFLCGRTLILPDGAREEARALDVERPEEWNEQRVCFHGVGAGEEQVVDAFCSGGSMERWKATVKLISPFPKVLVAFYASFCAPLLAVFNVPNFIVDLSNRTSTGKTTALRAAASVWGNPDERQASSLVGTWDATRVWTERASHVMSGLPLIMDDTKKARNERAVADLIYAVASGRGRGRGTVQGLAQTATWRTVMLSSGEQPATAYTQDGGTRTRVLSLRGTPFGETTRETGKVVSQINNDLCQHYGHAGPLFLSWLMKEREHWDGWRSMYQQWVDHYAQKSGTPEGGRLAQYAALITVAGLMSHEALNLPWKYDNPLVELWEDLAAHAADAAGDMRALEDVISWAGANEHTFIGRHLEDRFENIIHRGPVSGKWEKAGDYLAFYPNILREILRSEGYEPESILSGWRERGWLKHLPKKFTHDVKISGRESRKMVVLNSVGLTALGSANQEDAL